MKSKTIVIVALFVLVISLAIVIPMINYNKDIEDDNSIKEENILNEINQKEDDNKLEITISVPNLDSDEMLDKLEFDEEDYDANFENSLRDRDDDNKDYSSLPEIPESSIKTEDGKINIDISDHNNMTEIIYD